MTATVVMNSKKCAAYDWTGTSQSPDVISIGRIETSNLPDLDRNLKFAGAIVFPTTCGPKNSLATLHRMHMFKNNAEADLAQFLHKRDTEGLSSKPTCIRMLVSHYLSVV